MTKHDKALQEWRAWRDSGFSPTKAQAVLRTQLIQDTLNTIVGQFRGIRVDPAALENEATRQALEALPKFDESRGLQLNTFLTNAVRLNRMASKHSNFTRMPDAATQLQGPINLAKQSYLDTHGVLPTLDELHKHMEFLGHAVKKSDLKRAVHGNRRDLSSNQFSEELDGGVSHLTEEVIELLHDELTVAERPVYNLMYGKNGSPRIPETKDIAKHLKVPPATVYALRASIAKKASKYLP